MIERSWIWRCGAPTSLPEFRFYFGKRWWGKGPRISSDNLAQRSFVFVFFRHSPSGQITNRDYPFLLSAIQFTICWFLVSPIHPAGGLFVLPEFLIISCKGLSVRYYALVTTEGHSAGFISHTLLHRFKCHNLTHVHSSASGSMPAHHEHVAK